MIETSPFCLEGHGTALWENFKAANSKEPLIFHVLLLLTCSPSWLSETKPVPRALSLQQIWCQTSYAMGQF